MTIDAVRPDTTAAEVKEWVLGHRDDGVECPSCEQYAKVYRRKINSAMARALILFHRRHGSEWFHLPTSIGYGGDSAKLRYWGLIEESGEEREDGGRAGYWRVTEDGRQWALGFSSVAKYALVYNGKLLGLDDDERVSVRDALGTKFDYTELMNGV